MIINTRADLDALQGTAAYAEALEHLRGTLTIRVNVAEYPEGYGTPEYEGPEVGPVWDDQPSTEAIARLGVTPEEFEAACLAAGVGSPP